MNAASNDHQHGNIASIALAFEGGIGLVALALGWFFGVPPLQSVVGQSVAIGVWATLWGLAAAVLLFVALVLWDRAATAWMVHLREVVQQTVVPLFRGTTTGQLLLISLAAGVGEEMLYRGFVQDGLARWIGEPHGIWVALLVASVLFGVCHWVSGEYALLATVIGLALGGLFLATENLLAPIAMHALYDFLALVYLVRRYGEGDAESDEITAGG
jgi:membrane protease YdiL (CAAX protease family)